MTPLQNYMQGDRLQPIINDWSKVAGETVEMEVMEEDIYVFGSELACLRLKYHFKKGECETDTAYSSNLKTWYFLLKNVYSKP